MTTQSQEPGQSVDRDVPRADDRQESLSAENVSQADPPGSASRGATGDKNKETSPTQPGPGEYSADQHYIPGTRAWAGESGEGEAGTGETRETTGTAAAGQGPAPSCYSAENYHNVPGTATWTGTGAASGESEVPPPEATRGASAAKGIKGLASSVRGAGEAFRGNLMQGVDKAFGHEEGVEKHQKIAQAGMEKMRAARGQGGGAGQEGGT